MASGPRDLTLVQRLFKLLKADGLFLLFLSGVVSLDNQLLGHVKERLVHVRAGLGRSLDNLQVSVLLLELLDVCIGDLDLFGRGIRLIREYDDGDILPRVLLDLLHPGGHIEEGFLVAQVEDNDDAIRTLIVGVSDGPIPLLPGGVPDLQLDGRFVYLKSAESEVYSYRCDVVLAEAIILRW